MNSLDQVASEIFRVLKPGGRFYFAEIGLSQDESEARWQRRLNGLQRFFTAGCRLDLSIDAALKGAGLSVKRLDITHLDGLPKALGCTYEGFATRDA